MIFLNIKWKKTKLKTKLKVPRNSHSQIIFFFGDRGYENYCKAQSNTHSNRQIRAGAVNAVLEVSKVHEN